jgi:hypothetical protein
MLFEPTAAAAPFPVRLEADYPGRLSRLSTFFRLILAIPILVVLYLLGQGVIWVYWIGILVRGRPVRWLFDASVAILRFTFRAYAYFLLLTDRYPPFDGEWQVRCDVDYPERLSRWKLVIWKTVTVIPHAVVLALVAIAVMVVVVIAWFAVLFTGRYPEGLHGFVSGWLRWSARAWAYWASLTDEFPSFSFSADVGPGSSTTYVISAVLGWVIVLAWAAGIGTFLAWPGQTKEVTVSYDQLLQGQASAAVEVFDVEVTLLAAGELPSDERAVFQPEEGNRFVQFALRLNNGSDSGARVEKGDFRLTDSLGERRGPFVVTIDGRFAPRQVKADKEGNVWIVFEVDEDAQPAELRYDLSFGFKQGVKFTLD